MARLKSKIPALPGPRPTNNRNRTARRSRNQTQLQRLNGLQKNVLSDLQGLKPLKETRTLCRAYPSFVRMKRHDPQHVRLFPQPVNATESNLASARLKSLRGNVVFERFCRARLQAGTVDSSTRSPKGERYRWPARSCHTESEARPPAEMRNFRARRKKFEG